MKIEEAIKDHDYAIRYKPSDGGAMIYEKQDILWTLTDKYFKQIASGLIHNYDDWNHMVVAKHLPYFDLIAAAKSGQPQFKIHGKMVTLQPVIADAVSAPDDSRTTVSISETALKAAGQVAEALGLAIASYINVDRGKADAALKELLWVAKNVAWETKSNRYQYQPKPNPGETNG